MATSNRIRALNRLPFDFQDGLKVGGVDVTALNQTFTPAGAGLVGFTPVGNLSAGNVQAALAELESEKVGFARLDDTDGSSLVGYDGGTVQDVMDSAKPMADYTALRAYAGRATSVRITSNGLAGFFYRDDADTASVDNGGTVIVSSNGKRWKRLYSRLEVAFFMTASQVASVKAKNLSVDVTDAIQKGINESIRIGQLLHFFDGFYRVSDTISLLNANYLYSGGIQGENGNSTRIYFFNSTPLKNMFYVDSDVNYFTLCDIELIDNTPRTSRAFYFYDTRASSAPAWKHLFRNERITGFKEGVRFDGGVATTDDAHQSEVMFLHSKFRNCETGLIYNNTQAVNHQLIGVDFENDAEGVGDEWTHIKMERGTTVNHIGGSVIGKGSYLRYIYSTPAGFADTSQFASKGVRVEKRGGASPIINHDTDSGITVSNNLRIIIDDMPVNASGGATLFARFGGRSFAKFSNVHANVQMDIEAYMTANLSNNRQYGSIVIEDCQALNYKRISTVTAYGSAGVAVSNFQSIPAKMTYKNEGEQFTFDEAGYVKVSKPEQTIYSGSWETAQLKTLVYVNGDNVGFGSGSSSVTARVNLPLYGRPCKFRLLRDDVNAASAFVLTLRAVIAGLFGISNCANNGAGLIRVTTAGNHGLVTGDGVTITGVVGTTEADASWSTITVINATTFDLDGSTFTNVYVSGGTYTADKTVASITPTSGTGGHFEANVQTATGLTYFLNDEVNWDGKMKVVKSGTVNGFIGLIMIDYM